MKTIRLFKMFELKVHFSIQRVKRIEISIPDCADDAHLRIGLGDGGKDTQWNTSDGKSKVVYFKGWTKYEIEIPECKRPVEVFCTPLRDPEKVKAGISPAYYSNRKIIIDLYF